MTCLFPALIILASWFLVRLHHNRRSARKRRMSEHRRRRTDRRIADALKRDK